MHIVVDKTMMLSFEKIITFSSKYIEWVNPILRNKALLDDIRHVLDFLVIFVIASLFHHFVERRFDR
jgi:hypothetical protein